MITFISVVWPLEAILYHLSKTETKTELDQNESMTIRFASSCQHFFIPISLWSEIKFFWPIWWFQMNRVWKSAFASIFGLVDQIEMILTPNHFILTSLNMYLSFAQFTQFLLSLGFSLVSRFWGVNKAKGSFFYWLICFFYPWNNSQSQ